MDLPLLSNILCRYPLADSHCKKSKTKCLCLFLTLGPFSWHPWPMSLPAHSTHLVCSFQSCHLDHGSEWHHVRSSEYGEYWLSLICQLTFAIWGEDHSIFFVSHSTKKVPFQSRLTDLSLPEIRAWKPLSMANGESLATSSESSPDSTKRNRGQLIVIFLVRVS